MKLAILLLFYLIAPYSIILLTRRYKFFNKIGAVLICYALGFGLGLTDLLPEGSYQVQDIITSVTVPLALPLLLFNTQIKNWISLASRTFFSMILGIIALIIVVGLSFILFGDSLDNAWKISGLLVGLYTGGTPNLASLQNALNVTPEVYLMVNTYDIVLSSVFLLTIMATAGKFLQPILPSYKKSKIKFIKGQDFSNYENESFKQIFKKSNIGETIISGGAAILIAGLGIGLSFLLTGKISMLIIILSITSFGLVGSLIPKLNQTSTSFEGGMYLILVFSIAVASMVKLEDFIHVSSALFWFVSMVIFGTFFIHILLSALFRIDSDTTLITATAMICSPPFVPVIAGSLKNKEIIVSGLSVGIIGYAIGNYLGVIIAYTLHSLF
jgi:uncharacterized membrane protein